MKKLSFILMLCIILSLSSCLSMGISQNNTLAICGSFAVPGMFCNDLRGNTFQCEVLEEDQYGRILYEYTTHNIITNKEETAVVICQKIGSLYVYYYEDICYQYKHECNLDELKKLNSWDEPLDESKMSKRDKKLSIDNCIIVQSELSINEYRSICSEKLSIEKENIKEMVLLDKNLTRHEMRYVLVEKDSFSKGYIMIYIDRSNVYFHEITEDEVSSFIPGFKMQCDWIYG